MADCSLHNYLSQTITPYHLISKIAEVKTDDELRESLDAITSLLGFTFYQYRGSFVLDQHTGIRRSISSTPTTWNEKYSASEYEKIDPCIQHASHHLIPVIWSDLRDLTRTQQDFMEDARNHGIGHGVTFSIQAKNGDYGTLSFAASIDRSDVDEIIAQSLAYGHLTGAYVHETMQRIVNKERYMLQAPLKPRELEILQLIASGKSNWAISKILGTSEHVIVYYVRRLMWKFGVHNRYHAVSRAMALQLL